MEPSGSGSASLSLGPLRARPSGRLLSRRSAQQGKRARRRCASTALRSIAPSTSTRSITRCAAPVPRGAGVTSGRRCGKLAMHWGLFWGAVAFAAAPLFKRGVAYAMPLVGDRVRLAHRPPRSFRLPLRRRLFHASAHAPAAAGRAPVDAPSSCARPLQPPPSHGHIRLFCLVAAEVMSVVCGPSGGSPWRH